MSEPRLPCPLLRLPSPVLADIAARSGCQRSLRRTCKQLKDSIAPTSFRIAYQRVRDGQQELSVSHRLAATWREVTHVDVLGEDFKAASSNHVGIAEHTQLLLVFFSEVAAALMPWRHLQSADVPFSTSLVIALVATCQLHSLHLSDQTYREKSDDNDDDSDSEHDAAAEEFDEQRILRPQVTSCLNLLRGYHTLRTLKVALCVVWMEPGHVHALSQLTQLQELDLAISNDEQLEVDIETQDVIAGISNLKQLVSLKVEFAELCGARDLELGPLPCLRTAVVDLYNESVDAIWGQATLRGCPCLEEVTVVYQILGSPEWCLPLQNLRRLNLWREILTDGLADALAACSQLQFLVVGILYLTHACRTVFPALEELHFKEFSQCNVLFKVMAPQLRLFQAVRPDSYGASIAMLADHTKLASLVVPFSWLMEGINEDKHAVLASLTAVTSLHVVTDRTTESHPCCVSPRHAPSLSHWLGNLHDLRITRCFSDLSSRHLHALLRAVQGLRMLRCGVHHMLDYCAGEICMALLRPRYVVADVMVWGLSVCVRGMAQLSAIEVNLRWLLPEDEGRGSVGGLPHLVAFLVGLAAAGSRVALVRLVLPDGGWKRIKEGSDELKMFKAAHQHIESAHTMADLPFVVEVA